MSVVSERTLVAVDGIEYEFSVEKSLTSNNESISVFHKDDHVIIANAYVDHNLEQITVDINSEPEVVTANYYELGTSHEALVRWSVSV
jgi:hypothetical protein